MAFPTAAQVISDAAVELGLVASDITDPFASTDQNIIQLLRLLKAAGREVSRARSWVAQQTEYTFPTANGQSVYPMPSDFRSMIEQSGWNRTTRFPLGGPLTPQEWQYLKAQPGAATLTVLFRPRNGNIEVYPVPGATVATIAFEYVSSSWVAVTGSTAPTKDGPTVNTDVILFDPLLLIAAVKLKWKREKGFDSTAAQQDYDAAFAASSDDDAVAPVLRMDGKSGLGVRLLGDPNIPSLGWNQ